MSHWHEANIKGDLRTLEFHLVNGETGLAEAAYICAQDNGVAADLGVRCVFVHSVYFVIRLVSGRVFVVGNI